MTSAAAVIPENSRRIGDWLVGLALLLLVVGFAPTFYLKPVFEAGKPLTLLVIAHGAATTAWIAVFAFQYYTAGAGSRERHKTVGVIGAVLFGLVVALSLVTAVARVASADPKISGLAPLTGLAYPFWVLVEVTFFGVGALVSIRRPDWHRHFQLASFFSFIAPATARALRFVIPAGPGVTYGSLLISILLYAGASGLKDVRSGRVSRAALVALGVQFLTLLLLFFSLDAAPLWLQFASALTGYPL
ncbi:hypothetical protein [Methylocystis sp. Sn-Cys]|uniref:hypothetical protein n=1 Tax=Methylocystis sp. Sn-Cys TaxID=1701263 RepID=UPI0019238B87|nr:hypothetical protein [Methylocystis sp. Sn-Cys]MBL1257114.1 hypothetical protein [Methylocystis sp. Sn-Cys]